MAELVRVSMTGRVLAAEFYWRKAPGPEARRVFLGQACPGTQLDTAEDRVWI